MFELVDDETYMSFMKNLISAGKYHLENVGGTSPYQVRCYEEKTDKTVSVRRKNADGTFTNLIWIDDDEVKGVCE